MKIVVASDSFKGTLGSLQAGRAIAYGIRQATPDARVVVLPVADGGEGTTRAILQACGGQAETVRVNGPLGQQVGADFAVLADPTRAVVEMAAASGLTLLDSPHYDPMEASTYGTGQLIAAALHRGCRDLLVGAGGSATVDSGCGAAQALGVRFLTADGSLLEPPIGGGHLDKIHRIDLAGLDSLVADTDVTILCDVANPLCGPDGAARVFGPQKGADPQQVERLDRNLAHLAAVIRRDLHIDVRDLPGAGAAGGLAAGLVAFAGARLLSGADAVLDLVGLDRHLAGADLVITGEGRLDAQSMMGKVVGTVAARAAKAGVSVIALAGLVEGDAATFARTLDGWYAVTDAPATRLPAPDAAASALARRTAQVVAQHLA